MIIERIETIPYAIPFRKPMKFASGQVDVAEHVLLRVTTDTGITGVADVPPRPYTYGETQASVVAIIQSIFAPAILGLSPLDRGVIHQRLARTIGNHAAKGALDIAIWDILGQSVGTPVSRLLGGFTEHLRVAHMLGFAPAQEMLDEALRWQSELGVNAFKIKVGRHPLELDIEACHVLREGLGSGAELYLDANRGWTANEAITVLERTAGLGLTLFEEPCDALEVLGRRRLVAKSPIPVVGDESVPTLGDAARELHTGGCTAISIKTARSGFSESQKILALCEGLGVDVVMGNQIDTQLGTMATVAFGAAFELSSRRPAEVSNYLDLTDDLLAEPPVISDGRIAVSDAPGVGAVIDPDKLARYQQAVLVS
jgi:L-alanine-DL-glutamate epimerase-like enolase superfamily enzyme